MTAEKEPMIEIGGIWQNESKDGVVYFSGYLNGAQMLIFKNGYKKEGSREPDYKMYVKKAKPKVADAIKQEDTQPDVTF